MAAPPTTLTLSSDSLARLLSSCSAEQLGKLAGWQLQVASDSAQAPQQPTRKPPSERPIQKSPMRKPPSEVRAPQPTSYSSSSHSSSHSSSSSSSESRESRMRAREAQQVAAEEGASAEEAEEEAPPHKKVKLDTRPPQSVRLLHACFNEDRWVFAYHRGELYGYARPIMKANSTPFPSDWRAKNLLIRCYSAAHNKDRTKERWCVTEAIVDEILANPQRYASVCDIDRAKKLKRLFRQAAQASQQAEGGEQVEGQHQEEEAEAGHAAEVSERVPEVVPALWVGNVSLVKYDGKVYVMVRHTLSSIKTTLPDTVAPHPLRLFMVRPSRGSRGIYTSFLEAKHFRILAANHPRIRLDVAARVLREVDALEREIDPPAREIHEIDPPARQVHQIDPPARESGMPPLVLQMAAPTLPTMPEPRLDVPAPAVPARDVWPPPATAAWPPSVHRGTISDTAAIRINGKWHMRLDAALAKLGLPGLMVDPEVTFGVQQYDGLYWINADGLDRIVLQTATPATILNLSIIQELRVD